MDPLGSLQVCVYYVKQMNAFPALATKSMSALTGTGIINSDCATVQAHGMLRTGLASLNAEPEENLQINFSLLQKFLFFSPTAENLCLTSTFHWKCWSRALDMV